MTEGTSQGLFIVVAIVIFGIFVVLAYILFEDTLSPALANMFMDATETASDRLIDKSKPFDANQLLLHNPQKRDLYIVSQDSSQITFESTAPNNIQAGVYIEGNHFKQKGSYILEYDITLLGGEMYQLGGHIHLGNEKQDMYINDVKQDSIYYVGNPYAFEKDVPVRIKVHFEHQKEIVNDKIYIQPNRGAIVGMDYLTPYKVQLSNVTLTKVR